MKLHIPAHIDQAVLEKSRKDIDAVNSYMDSMKGTVVSVQTIRSGQGGPYQDSFYEAYIFCHQPNVLTTNAPCVRVIDEAKAKAIARMFVHDFDDVPACWSSAVLNFIRPCANPCGLNEFEGHTKAGLSSCWHVQISCAYTG